MNRKMKPMPTATPFHFDYEFSNRTHPITSNWKARMDWIYRCFLVFLGNDFRGMHGICAVGKG